MGYLIGSIFVMCNYFGWLNVDWQAIVLCFVVNFGFDLYDYKYPDYGGY